MDVDPSRLRRGELLAGAGAVLLLVFMLAGKWAGSRSGFQTLVTLRWLIVVTIASAFGLVILQVTRRAPAVPVTMSMIVTVLGLITVLALIYRPLVLDCVDPGFLRSVSRAGGIAHLAFLALLVLNLISGFHALGTLLGVGIIIIPAAIARFWTRDISIMILLAIASGLLSGWAGLLLSFHAEIPSGPAVTLVAGLLYVGSILFGRVGGLLWLAVPQRHLEA